MISTKQAAVLLKVTERRVRVLCVEGRVNGALKVGRAWILPDAPKVDEANPPRTGKIDFVKLKSRKVENG